MRRCAICFLAVSFAAITAASIDAQFPMTEGATVDRERSSKNEDTTYELEARIAAMRYLIDQAGKRAPERKKDPKLALAELQDDFTHLQLTNKDLVLKVNDGKPVDLKFVAKAATDINKRAERLIANLALPDPNRSGFRPVPDPIVDEKQLRASITKLGWLIYYFTKNPIFKEAQVIDAASAGKARTDLDSILDLSSHIKKSSEQIVKAKD